MTCCWPMAGSPRLCKGQRQAPHANATLHGPTLHPRRSVVGSRPAPALVLDAGPGRCGHAEATRGASTDRAPPPRSSRCAAPRPTPEGGVCRLGLGVGAGALPTLPALRAVHGKLVRGLRVGLGSGCLQWPSVPLATRTTWFAPAARRRAPLGTPLGPPTSSYTRRSSLRRHRASESRQWLLRMERSAGSRPPSSQVTDEDDLAFRFLG